MKNLVALALVLFTLNGMAQERRKNQSDRKGPSEMMKQMTPNDIADLKSKKLTLKLDLTDAQQKKAHDLILTQAQDHEGLRKERQARNIEKREKPSKDEFVKMENRRLDQQIKMKREMKALLTPEQYVKFEKMNPRKHKKEGKRGKKG